MIERMVMWHPGRDNGEKPFAVPVTKVNEFSLLFQFDGPESEIQERVAAQSRLLRQGRGLYERGGLRNWHEMGNTCHADVVDGDNLVASVAVRMQERTITGIGCTCAQGEAPRCVHACAVCFRLFYRNRYSSKLNGKIVIPCEVSEMVDRCGARRLGAWVYGEDAARETALGLEHLIGLAEEYRYQRWLDGTHFGEILGNCIPSVEEEIDMDTDHWPDPKAPDLTADLPHG